MDGILRHIPNPTIAKKIFGEQWDGGVRNELDMVTITTGCPLPSDICIVRFGENPGLYLSFTEPHATRPIIRPITNTAIKNGYGLHGPVITLPAHTENDYDKHAPLQSPEAILERPDLNGKRIHDGGTGQVYLIIDGVLRYIPNPETANRIFGSDWGVDGDIIPDFITKSTPLPENARIIRFGSKPELYLSFKEPGEPKAVIRHIPNMLVLKEYGLYGKVQNSSDSITAFLKESPVPPASSVPL